MIVCKFGGSCTALPEAIKNIKELASGAGRKAFVFSAIGRESVEDKKVTDLLIDYSNGDQSAKEKVLEKYKKLLKFTGVRVKIKSDLDKIFNEFLKTKDRSKLLSRGEFLTAYIMSKYLNIKFVPAEKLLFYRDGILDFDKSRSKAKFYLSKYGRIVVPGFYAIENGKIKLFSRGGGDVSGALISALLDAEIYENWTDIEGIFEVNPNVLNSQPIKTLSYEDLKLMTSLDAKVVHEECAKILSGTHVKLKVKSIFAPQKEGTLISNSEKNSSGYICFTQNGDSVKIYLCKSFKNYIVLSSTKEKYRDDIKNLYSFLK